MAKPKELNIIIRFDDGSQKECNYLLDEIRNGENPHQSGYVGEPGDSYKEIIKGRGMSFTNHLDLSAYSVALEISKTMNFLRDKRKEVVVINKHTNPAVLAARINQINALNDILMTDMKSSFGGVLATSSEFKLETANLLINLNSSKRFVLDVIIAPGYEDGCIEILTSAMKNLRIINTSTLTTWEKVNSGLFGFNMKWTIGNKPVITEADTTSFFNTKYGMEILSERKPTDLEFTDAHIAWIGAKAIQSNSFVFIKDALLLAQCGGQTNREDSAKFANERALEFNLCLTGSTAATDSFIFDRKAIDMLHEMGAAVVVHPTRKYLTTGSLKADKPIINAINDYKMVMIRPYLINEQGKETSWRVFKHL